MNKQKTPIFVAFLCALFLWNSSASGDTLTGGTFSNLTVTTATSSIAALNVSGTDGKLTLSGTMDILSNTLLLGTVFENGDAGVSFAYTDGTTSKLILQATRASHQWLWAHQPTSGTNIVPMMQLDSSHNLNLFSPTNSTNPIIVIDPTLAQIRINGNSVSGGTGFPLLSAGNLSAASVSSIAVGDHANASGTASAAFGISVTASGTGAFATGVNSSATGKASAAMGIGTIANGVSQLAIGQYNIALGNAVPGSLSGSDVLFVIGNGTVANPRNALTLTASAQLNLFDPLMPTAPSLVLDPTASGTSQIPGALQVQGPVIIPPVGDVGMGQYTAASGTTTPTNGPRFLNVTNAAARFALTAAQVKVGDMIEEMDTRKVFQVVDTAQLNRTWGYVEIGQRPAIPGPMPAGPVAEWLFAPGAPLADTSGNGNTLSNINGVTFSNGVATVNNGSYLSSGPINGGTASGGVTISCWARIRGQEGWAALLMLDGPQQFQISAEGDGDTWRPYFIADGYSGPFNPGVFIDDDNAWHFYALRYDANGVASFWIDGTEYTRKFRPSTWYNTNWYAYLGSSTGAYSLNCDLSRCRYFGRSLSDSDIAALFEEGNGQ